MDMATDISQDVWERSFFAIVAGEVRVWDAVQDALQDAGLPVSVARLVPLLALTRSPMRLQELAACTHAKESAASRLVERMVKDGLVTKGRDASDGRAVVLRITDKGRRVAEQGRAVFARTMASVCGNLSEREVETLCSLLARIASPQADVPSPRHLTQGVRPQAGERT